MCTCTTCPFWYWEQGYKYNRTQSQLWGVHNMMGYKTCPPTNDGALCCLRGDPISTFAENRRKNALGAVFREEKTFGVEAWVLPVGDQREEDSW